MMCDAYTAMDPAGDDSPEEDRIAVFMFVAEERGKDGKLQEQVCWGAVLLE